jgi:hypothetical protein
MSNVEEIATRCCGEYIQKITMGLLDGIPEIVDLYTGLYHSSLTRVTDHQTRKQIESAFAQLYEVKKR